MNPKGGIGNNIETDLCMEHSVRNRKDLIKALGSNKSEATIQRVNLAADTVSHLVSSLRTDLGISEHRNRKTVLPEHHAQVMGVLRQLQPFKTQVNRSFGSKSVCRSPFTRHNSEELKCALLNSSRRLSVGALIIVDDDDDDDDDEFEENNNNNNNKM